MLIALSATSAQAQAKPATLVGRAVLPAEMLADGPKAGQSLKKGSINGIRIPFDSQPVGTITAMLPGEYANTWTVLTGGVFDSRPNSGDYLLRLYTVEMSLRTANGGDGSVSVLDWRTLADPGKKIKQDIKNKSSRTRELTGADFNPRGLARAKDGSFWIAETYGPSLLHVSEDGALLDTPFALDGAGALAGMSALPDKSALVVVQRAPDNSDTLVLRTFDLSKRTITGQRGAYRPDGGSALGGLVMISGSGAQAGVAITIELDGQQNNRAQSKKLYLADLSASPANKTLLVDLLNVADPAKISIADVFGGAGSAFGVGQVFKFPYVDIGAVYPLNEKTVIVVNNNRIPFGLGRVANQADDTDYAAIELPQAVPLDAALRSSR